MKQSRADEIVRKVIYGNLCIFSRISYAEDAFNVGRAIGKMQLQLETELSKEVDEEEAEE